MQPLIRSVTRFVGLICVIWMCVAVPSSVSAVTRQLTPLPVANAQLYARSVNQFASAVVIDATTGKRLYSYLPNTEWPAASLTKLMSAMVFVDQKPNWSKTVVMSKKDSVGGGELSVKDGSKISITDLFYSSIVASANNAAIALARVSSLGTSGFIKKMNAKAKALGLSTTHFVDPSGIDPANVTTASEMAVIAGKAFSTPMIRRAATTKTYTIALSNPVIKKELNNTNHLLTRDDQMYVLGGKTGFLYESRYNLAVKLRPVKADPARPPLLVVVLGSPTYAGSFASAKGLANWAWKAYTWSSP